jgi:hypothetical protein
MSYPALKGKISAPLTPKRVKFVLQIYITDLAGVEGVR